MNKKDKQKQKSSNTKQHQSQSLLSITPTAETITIQLPSHLNNASVDKVLLKHYLKAKIIHKKKVSIKEPIVVTVFGKQQILFIQSIKKLSLQHENQVQLNQTKLEQIFCVNQNLQIIFTTKQNKKQNQEAIGFQAQNFSLFHSESYDNFKKIVLQNFNLRQKLQSTKLGAIRGIMISGPTGTGKTTIVNKLKFQLQSERLQNNQKVYFHSISATHLLSRVVGGAQQYVRKTFKSLSEHKYSVFIIEDLHLLFGQKSLSAHETTLAALFSQMESYPKALIVIGTYNSQRDLSSVVFQSGRFEKQIVLNLPNHHQRFEILKQMFDNLNLKNKLSEEDLKQFNLRLNGFSIGQIKQILRDAYIMKGQLITKQILLQILKLYRPAQIRELIVEVPEVYWSGIGGYQSVKHQIRKVTQLPLKHPQKFEALGIQPSKGVLLYGPPGCSKTMMAKAIATESKLNFIGIKGPELYSKYVGESERAIRNVFRKARAFSPCIIFFDQIDALATQRNDQNDVTNRLLGQLLTQMDGVEGLKQVIIIAATNRPEILDEALTRPGRFDHLIYVGPPDLQAREQIFKICLKKTPLVGQLSKISRQMAQNTANYTGAQITLLCRQAALSALQQNIQSPTVKLQNLQSAMMKVRSRLTPQSIARYENYKARFQQGFQNQFGGIANEFGKLNISNSNPFKI